MSKSVTPAKAKKRFNNYLNRVSNKVHQFKDNCTNKQLVAACDMIHNDITSAFAQLMNEPDAIIIQVYNNRLTAIQRILEAYKFSPTITNQFSSDENKHIIQIFAWDTEMINFTPIIQSVENARTYVPLDGTPTKTEQDAIRSEFDQEFNRWLDHDVKYKVGDIKLLDPQLYQIYTQIKLLFHERFRTIINDADFSNVQQIFNDRINYFEQYLQNLMQTTIESEGQVVDMSDIITIDKFETLKEIFNYRSALEREAMAA